jgi:predicted dehydrogenase
MKVAILGLGSIGRRHARCFRMAGADVLVGMDPTPERRKQFVDEIGADTVATEAEALDLAPDLVVVASPNIFHVRQAVLAAERGMPLFVEKPLGVDLAEAERLTETVRTRGVYLHMGSNWKFHPAFVLMKRLIADGAIGRPTGGQVIAGQWLPDWHPYEDYRQMYAARRSLGGGAIFDTHEIDYLSWLLGPTVQFVGLKANTGVLEIETEDTAAALIRFANGAIVSLLTDYIQRTPRRRYLLAGDGGTIEWDFHTGEVTLCRPGNRFEERHDVRLPDVNDMYVAQARRVLDDIRFGRPAMTGIEHALDVLRLQTAWREERMLDRR